MCHRVGEPALTQTSAMEMFQRAEFSVLSVFKRSEMMFRVLPLIVAAVAVVVAADVSAYAADKDETHQGTVVKAGDGKLTMTMKDDEAKKEHTHNVGADVKIRCDGKECKLSDLKKGDTVTVTEATKDGKKTVTKIEAKKPV